MIHIRRKNFNSQNNNRRGKLLFHPLWVRIVSGLAALVMFCTVYALILPAAAITGTEATEESGFYLEDSADSGTDTDVLAKATEEGTQLVNAESTDGEGTGSTLKETGSESSEQTTDQAVKAAGQTSESVGQTIETADQTVENADQASGSADQSSEAADQTAETTEESVRVVDQTSEITEEIVKQTDDLETDQEANQEADQEISEEEVLEDASEEAVLSSGELIFEGEDYTVSLAYEKEAKIPEKAFLKVEELTEGDDYENCLKEAAETVEKKEQELRARLFDITICVKNEDGEDEEIQPAGAVRVSIAYDEAVKLPEDAEMQVVHLAAEKSEEENSVLDVETEGKGTEVDGVAFDAEHFSVFVVMYTVDFHWDVDGKKYDFSLPGGGFVSLKALMEVLNIAGVDRAEGGADGTNVAQLSEKLTLNGISISEDTEKFVEDISKVEFSSPELVWVHKIDSDSTVGTLKKENALDCQYSAELSEEDIAEINAQTVEAGDWALVSMQPFDTEESLTVTMKTGEVFSIAVTDDQENPFGLDGKSFAITAHKASNNADYYLGNDGTGISSSNPNCLKAYSFNPSSGGTPQGATWTFEWTGEGKKYLIHDNNNRYILIENDKVSLTDKDTALANPITVISRNGKYSFVNEKNNQALNIFGIDGFGRWPYSAENSDFMMALQKPSDMKQPGTIATADTSGLLQINLFDYGPENEIDKEANNNSSPYAGGINDGHTLKFFSYGKNVGTGINDFTGAGNGPQTGIVADQLSENYPVLASNPSESLNYLFGGAQNSYVTPYTGLNHLFTKDENGYYHYDSDQNYAYLNGTNFEVYSKTFPEEGADEQYFGVGFFPFDQYNEYYNCIHGKEGFERWKPHTSGTNKSGHYNHHFGMSLAGNFIMPPGGQYNGKDVTFQFSGDDDMWVFVDGVLIMDIGGIHNPVSGEINFTTGEVTVHGAAQENFKEKYKRITGKDWDDSDFSNHDFRVFYMERGGMYSNLEVTFNLPLTPATQTNNFQFDKVSSENTSIKLSGAEFALFTDQPCTQPFTLASVPMTANSDENGVVSFKNVPYGTYYMKETAYPQGYQAKDPEEIFTVVVDANGGTITSSSSGSITQVTNQPKKTDVEVEKVWVNGSAPAGAQVEVVLGRYKLIEDPNAPGTATLVIKDSYTGLPSGSAYHVTYTITGPNGYSHTITKSYTDSSNQIEESVEVPATVAGSQYTVTKQVRDIAYHNIANQSQTVNATVAKNGTEDAQFNQSAFSRNAYSITIYSIDRNGNQTTVSRWVDPTYYSSGSSVYLRCYYKTDNDNNGGYARDRRFQYSFDNNSFTDFTLENQGWTNQIGKTAAFTIDHDISIYIKCKDNLNWSNGYDWFVNPTIVGADPVQTTSASHMMMSMRLGAPALTAAQTLSMTASAPTLPAPPQNTLYVLDEDYADNPDKIVLSGGTWNGRKDDLIAWNEYGPYVYYIAAVNESGMPEGTQITIEDEVTLDGSAKVLTVTNTLPTGYLRIDKSVTYNGNTVPENKKGDLAGTYTFKVYTDANCTVPYKVKQGETETDLKLTVTINADGAAKSSDPVKLPVGDYWIEEQTPSQTGVTPDENRIHVQVTKDSTTSSPATAGFVNNKDESNNPDEQAIELEKEFTGITDPQQIPAEFSVTLKYSVPGSEPGVSEWVTVTLNSSTEGHVTCTKSEDGLTWHWRITHIPANATDFSVSESNYDIDGYTRVTKINGQQVADPSSPEGITVLQPEITLKDFWSEYTTADNKKVFPVTGDQILLVRSTTGVTVVVTQKSLSMAVRKAIEDLIINNDGKIPGDPDASAKWSSTFIYFSHEIQGDSFSYGGRTIDFDGNNVKIPNNASSQVVRVDIQYKSESAQNSFVLENAYNDIPIEVDLLKVEKGKETSTQLAGAVFELRKLNDTAPTAGGTLDYVKDNDGEVIVTSKTTDNQGKLTYDGLTGGIYEIREKTPPEGYVLSEEIVFYMKVEQGTVSYVEKGTGEPSTWHAATGDNEMIKFTPGQAAPAVNAQFRVANTPGVALPSTGGSGTKLFTILGTILMLGAGMMLFRRRFI